MGILAIPHHVARDADIFYNQLFDGKMLALPEERPRERKLLALAADVDEDTAMLPLGAPGAGLLALDDNPVEESGEHCESMDGEYS